jgi:hypothetical protein
MPAPGQQVGAVDGGALGTMHGGRVAELHGLGDIGGGQGDGGAVVAGAGQGAVGPMLSDRPVGAVAQLRRHDLRHTGLTWMAAGVPVHVLQRIAGHGSLTTTQRYLHPDGASIAAVGTALSAHLAAGRSTDGPQGLAEGSRPA